jgi:ABC-2 type transport system permease protein
MFNSKKQINRANALIAIIVVIALIFFINILSANLFGRWDMTENKDFSISGTTKDILRNLDDVINVKAYFTEELPGYLLVTNQDVRDILSEYGTVSNGNVIVTFLDPSKDEAIEQEARAMGIPTLQFNVVEKDKYQVTNGYLGIAVFYGDEREIIPITQDTSSLEYDLTAAISKVVREEVPTVAFLSGRGSWGRTNDFEQVNQELQRQYRVRDFNITEGTLVPESVNTLIIPGVKEELTQREQYVIDQFLMRGGDILIMTEGVQINPVDLTVEKQNTGIGELVAQYGIRLNKNLALDTSNELAAFRTDQVQFFSPYPFWIKVPKAGFNPDSGIVNKLESLVLTWGSTIEVLEEKLTDKTERTDLVRTTANAWTQDGDWQLNPKLIPPPEEGTQASEVLGTMLSGRFESLFSKDEIPPTISTDEEGNTVEEPVSSEEKDKFLSETEEGRLIVIGDADFALDINLQRFQSNAVFFLNLVDALTTDESLINIRSKAVTDRPLKELSEGTKNTIRWANILGIPALFTLYGLVRFTKRRKTKSII